MRNKCNFENLQIVTETHLLSSSGRSTLKAFHFLQILFLVLHSSFFIASEKDVICQNFKFVVDNDVVYNYILEGHVFKRSTVHNAAQCHMMCKDDCLCISMNYFPVFEENNCELNDINKEMEPAALKWKQGVNYYDLVRDYIAKVSCACYSIYQLETKMFGSFLELELRGKNFNNKRLTSSDRVGLVY